MRELMWNLPAAACLLWAGLSTGWCQPATPLSQSGNLAGNIPSASSPSQSPRADLTALRLIAADALRIAETGDLSAARKRIDDLERVWNREAPAMKLAAPEKWRTLDSVIDRAERELRFWRVRRTDSVEALRELVRTLESTS